MWSSVGVRSRKVDKVGLIWELIGELVRLTWDNCGLREGFKEGFWAPCFAILTGSGSTCLSVLV